MIKNILDFFRENFSLDARSIGIARIIFASLVLIDLVICRAPDFDLLYQPDGVYPIEIAQEHYIDSSQMVVHDPANFAFSAYYWVDSYAYSVSIYVLTVASLILLALGYKTQFFAFLAWFLIVSLQNRMPFNMNPADFVTRLFLLSLIFLPSGKFFSLDYIRRKANGNLPASPKVSGAGVFQFWVLFASFFITVSIGKLTESWLDGSAVYYMMTSRFGTDHSFWIAENLYWLTKGMTYLTIFGEICFPLLIVFSFGKKKIARLTGVLAYCGLLFGMFLMLEVSLISFLSAAVLLSFLPEWFWVRLSKMEMFSKLSNYFSSISAPTDTIKQRTIFKKYGSLIYLAVIGLICFSYMWNETNRLHWYVTRGEDKLIPMNPKVEIFMKQVVRSYNYYVMFGFDLRRLPRFYLEGMAYKKSDPEKYVNLFDGSDRLPTGFVFEPTDVESNFRLRRLNFNFFAGALTRDYPELAKTLQQGLARNLCIRHSLDSNEYNVRFRVMSIPPYPPGSARPEYTETARFLYNCNGHDVTEGQQNLTH